MIEQATKRQRCQRLRHAGLWKLAQGMMADVRNTLKSKEDSLKVGMDKHDRDIASIAWDYVYEMLAPVCATIEQLKVDVKNKPADPSFVGFLGDPEELVDPLYEQSDLIRKFADAYIWLEDEFRRVVYDSPDGTVLDFSKSTRPPPTVFTVQLCEEYARAKPGSPQRKKLAEDIQKALSKLPKDSHSGEIGYAGDL